MIKLLLNFSGRINTMAQNGLFPNSLRKDVRWLDWNDWFERSMRLGRPNERKVGLAADHEQRERCTTLIALTSLHSVRKTSLALIQHREKLRVNWALRSRQLIALCDTIFVWSASKSTERQSWRRRTNKHVWSVPVRCVATQQISSTL